LTTSADERIIRKQILKKWDATLWLYSFDARQRPVADSFEYGNEFAGSIKDRGVGIS
jgi:hypothetical protein